MAYLRSEASAMVHIGIVDRPHLYWLGVAMDEQVVTATSSATGNDAEHYTLHARLWHDPCDLQGLLTCACKDSSGIHCKESK